VSTVSGPSSRVVVAMDGPSGAGKSSASRGAAEALGLRYLDTGSMYRAMTCWMLGHGVDVGDPAAVAAAVDGPELAVGTDPAAPTIRIDGTDVAGPIRSPEVTAAVSAVSAVPQVRARMVALQRSIIGDGGIVVEGRDIGTTVAPDAEVKVFLTADPATRARRRAAEVLAEAPDAVDPHAVADAEATMSRRDSLDATRSSSPMTKAPDAHEIDATDLTLDEVVDRVVALVDAAAQQAAR